MDAKIDLRSGVYYLVNTSTAKRYEFTVKKTEVKNDSASSYSTQLIRLAPGDEKALGNESYTSSIRYLSKTKERKVLNTLTLAEYKKMNENLFLDTLARSIGLQKTQYSDTEINGMKLKYNIASEEYVDTIAILPPDHFKYKYEVTGQAEFKKD